MCATCGCSEADTTSVDQSAVRPTRPGRLEHLEIQVLAKNDALAQANRRWLRQRAITALNLMSSPGSGKTTLLVRTLTDLAGQMPLAVIEGDQETRLDAERIGATGAPVVQINTGSGCHLDADMLRTALDRLEPADESMLFIENVGNLVCPALFDLGEAAKVVVISVTEGDDKPLKYPHMFAGADLMLINKLDLLPYVEFDVAACVRSARQVNPRLTALTLSARSGEGMASWYEWARARAGSGQRVRQGT
jgi:hydrogenase nickel incorporation protein HypB